MKNRSDCGRQGAQLTKDTEMSMNKRGPAGKSGGAGALAEVEADATVPWTAAC